MKYYQISGQLRQFMQLLSLFLFDNSGLDTVSQQLGGQLMLVAEAVLRWLYLYHSLSQHVSFVNVETVIRLGISQILVQKSLKHV